MHCEQKFIYHKQRARTLRNYLQGYAFDDDAVIYLVVLVGVVEEVVFV